MVILNPYGMTFDAIGVSVLPFTFYLEQFDFKLSCVMTQKLETYQNSLNCAFYNLHISEIMYSLSANDPCVVTLYFSLVL